MRILCDGHVFPGNKYGKHRVDKLVGFPPEPITFITKAYLYNFDPLKPRFYKVKKGFTGVYIIFLFLLKNILLVLVRTASVRRF